MKTNRKTNNTNRKAERWEERDVELHFSPCFSRFALSTLTTSLCLLLAYFHASIPFVWGLCWSCPHNLLWAAVLLSLWSASACIITEQWTLYPEVRRLLRIWQNNYAVISLKTDARILSSAFQVTQEFTFPTVMPSLNPLTLKKNSVCVWETGMRLESNLWWKRTTGEVSLWRTGQTSLS